jgi:rubrerythrin
MAAGTLLFGLALFILIALIVSLPLVGRKRPAVRPTSRREVLERERESVVREIRELDFDYRTGKVSDEDYKRLREARVAHGAALLRELASLEKGELYDPERAIEEQVMRLRTVLSSNGKPGVALATCPQCGQPVRPNDRFCPQCGARLRPQQDEAILSTE